MSDPSSHPTEVSSVAVTVDATPRAQQEWGSNDEGLSPSRPHPCMALVEGSRPPEMSCELEALLRRRLRLAAALLCAGFAVFVIRHALALEWSWTSISLFAFHLGVTLVLGLAAWLLYGPLTIPLHWLRIAELTVFGAPAAFFVALQVSTAIHYAGQGQFVFDAGPWLVLIFAYALFIPNTIRRAAAVIGTMAVVPIVMLMVICWAWPSVASTATAMHLTSVPLLLVVSAIGAVFGVDTIGHLRKEAFQARQLGQYRLKKRIGAGGMGEVFLAEHQLLKRPCVIKLIRPDKAGDPKTLARFQREVRATARLTHWNTVEIFDYGSTDEGVFYYVMEYLPGMSLADLVERYGPMPPERVIYLLRQACDALAEAHAAGLIHRDIKPANIFVAQRGGVYDVLKLLDFGLVKPTAGEHPIALTTEGSITGSPLFMSPEQAIGDGEPDARSDIYSLGAVAYCLVTGRPPFEGDKPIKVLIAHVHEDVVPPSRVRPDVPEDLERVILRCLAKEPVRRFPNAMALDQALAQCGAAAGWSRSRAAQWWGSRELATPTAAVS